MKYKANPKITGTTAASEMSAYIASSGELIAIVILILLGSSIISPIDGIIYQTNDTTILL